MGTKSKREVNYMLPGKEKYLEGRLVIKNFVKLSEATDLFSIGGTKLRELAEKAGAVYKIDGLVLINIARFEDYLEQYRVWGEDE